MVPKQVRDIIRLRLAQLIYLIMGPTGFDSETNGNVSMSSAGIQLVNIIFHTFNWRKQLRSCRLIRITVGFSLVPTR